MCYTIAICLHNFFINVNVYANNNRNRSTNRLLWQSRFTFTTHKSDPPWERAHLAKNSTVLPQSVLVCRSVLDTGETQHLHRQRDTIVPGRDARRCESAEIVYVESARRRPAPGWCYGGCLCCPKAGNFGRPPRCYRGWVPPALRPSPSIYPWSSWWRDCHIPHSCWRRCSTSELF